MMLARGVLAAEPGGNPRVRGAGRVRRQKCGGKRGAVVCTHPGAPLIWPLSAPLAPWSLRSRAADERRARIGGAFAGDRTSRAGAGQPSGGSLGRLRPLRSYP